MTTSTESEDQALISTYITAGLLGLCVNHKTYAGLNNTTITYFVNQYYLDNPAYLLIIFNDQ